jgi:hypothetical protein
MIQINEVFSCERDKYQWLLHQKKPKGKHPITGELSTKESTSVTYHSNPEQIMNVVINRSLGKCESLVEMRDMLVESREMVSKACAAISKANT